MPDAFLLGESRRLLDERYRVQIPTEMADALSAGSGDCILAKERSGALSLWNSDHWQDRLDQGVQLVEDKLLAGRLEGRIEQVQLLGRLLSTRHTTVRLAARGRLTVPEGFRDFLAVEPGSEMMVVGAAVCVELWRPDRWFAYVQENIPQFRELFDRLSG
jgi:MraZ protein